MQNGGRGVKLSSSILHFTFLILHLPCDAPLTTSCLCGRCGEYRRAIVATFLRTVAHSAFLLRRFLKQKRRVALRAMFGNGLVPENHIALRILRAAVKDFAALRFLDDDLALASSARTGHARCLAFDVTTLRIV